MKNLARASHGELRHDMFITSRTILVNQCSHCVHLVERHELRRNQSNIALELNKFMTSKENQIGRYPTEFLYMDSGSPAGVLSKNDIIERIGGIAYHLNVMDPFQHDLPPVQSSSI